MVTYIVGVHYFSKPHCRSKSHQLHTLWEYITLSTYIVLLRILCLHSKAAVFSVSVLMVCCLPPGTQHISLPYVVGMIVRLLKTVNFWLFAPIVLHIILCNYILLLSFILLCYQLGPCGCYTLNRHLKIDQVLANIYL